MNELQAFDSKEFGRVRTLLVNNEPYFVGRDVAIALGYKDTVNAIKAHVDTEDKGVAKCHTLGGAQDLTVINESGVYSLVFGSKLESAKRFKRWVTSEVLPSIRKHGAYMNEETLEQALLSPDFLMRLAGELKAEKEKRQQAEALVEKQKPKAIFADAVCGSENSILIGELAKMIKQQGVDIGQKRMFEWMRKNGYLMQKGGIPNYPTQKSMDLKVLEVKERAIANADGSTRLTFTTKVTGKGQVYFVNKFFHVQR